MNVRALFLTALLTGAASLPASGTISWEVENRFPLFTTASDFVTVSEAWPLTSSGARASVVEFTSRPGFTAWLRDHLRPDRTAWDRVKQVYRKHQLFASRHTVVARIPDVEDGANCSWSINAGKPFSQPCNEPFKFPIETARHSDQPAAETSPAFSVSVDISGSRGVRRHELEQQKITVEFIVAIGDSFASGEGNPDWPTKFKARRKAGVAWFVDGTQTAHTWIEKGSTWWDEPCHRSLLSWPALFALDRSVRNKHLVVQFASLACSGAEVYDGFFRAQMDPPGRGYESQVRRKSKAHRDGGQGFSAPSGPQGEESGVNVITRGPQRGDYFLRYSQHNALARLVCASTVRRTEEFRGEVVDGVRPGQTYYGPTVLEGCAKPERTPSHVLMSFGGNDVGFGGVVADQITPKNAKGGPLHGFKQFFWNVARSAVTPIPYEKARAAADSELPAIYEHLARSLVSLHIQPEAVRLAIYPDPTGTKENRKTCLAFTQEANAPLSWVLRQGIVDTVGIKKTGVPFGINEERLTNLQVGFVEPLRTKQMLLASALKWGTLDSNVGVRVGSNDHGLCAISPACTEASCSSGDRVSHWPRSDSQYTKYPRHTYLHEYDPYDPSRTRGFRLAVDAVLTNAKPQPPGPKAVVHPNWLSGNVHPTLSVHARMAAALSSCSDPNCGRQ